MTSINNKGVQYPSLVPSVLVLRDSKFLASTALAGRRRAPHARTDVGRDARTSAAHGPVEEGVSRDRRRVFAHLRASGISLALRALLLRFAVRPKPAVLLQAVLVLASMVLLDRRSWNCDVSTSCFCMFSLAIKYLVAESSSSIICWSVSFLAGLGAEGSSNATRTRRRLAILIMYALT